MLAKISLVTILSSEKLLLAAMPALDRFATWAGGIEQFVLSPKPSLTKVLLNLGGKPLNFYS